MNAIAEQLDHQIQLRYRRWLHADLPGYLRKELGELKASEMTDRFYRHLTLGTEGVRERVGVGSNRVNIYTIRRIARALALLLKEQGAAARRQGVVIGYDGRLSSRGFAQQAALTLAYCGVQVYLLEQARPTPQLSYAVRELGTAAGIVITAGHYPREYNGCKIYDATGAPMSPELSGRLAGALAELEDELAIPLMPQDAALSSGRLVMVGKELDQRYRRHLEASVPLAKISKAKAGTVGIVFTALHGTGGEPLRALLQRAKYTKVYEVKEQSGPDPFFSAAPHPDPSCPEALGPALRLARSVQADIVLALDPEAQRLSLSIRDTSHSYRTLRPGETGALLLDYICMQVKRKDKSAASGKIYTSVLEGGLAERIAARYGMELQRTLPGFRHIAAAMAEREARETRPQVEPPTERGQTAYGRHAFGRLLSEAEAVGAGASLAASPSPSRLAWRESPSAGGDGHRLASVRPVARSATERLRELRAAGALPQLAATAAGAGPVGAAPPSGGAATPAGGAPAAQPSGADGAGPGAAQPLAAGLAASERACDSAQAAAAASAAALPSGGAPTPADGAPAAVAAWPSADAERPESPPPFRFAYDESGGYLPSDGVRDRDALQTALLIAEMTAYYRAKRLSLAKRLQQLYEQHGHHLEGHVSLAYRGLEGWQRVRNAMEKLRAAPPTELGSCQVNAVCDYGAGEARHRHRSCTESGGLPTAEILKYELAGGGWCAVRASSAEPVLTLYYGCRADTARESRHLAAAIRSDLLARIEAIL